MGAPLLGLSVLWLTASGCGMLLDSLIFLPDRSFVDDPPAGAEERWIATPDGVRLHAWWNGKPGRPTLLWSHGNAGNISWRADVFTALASRDLNVLAYDYRGYGKSDGRPSEAGAYRDAEAAYDSLREDRVRETEIVCFGESLGGAVSIRLATRRPCAGLALVSTFTTMKEVARSHYGPLAGVVGDRFDSLSRIRELRLPLFQAHGDRDEVVPFELGWKLFEAANPPKRFFHSRGYAHNDVFDSPGLIDAIAEFARQVAGGKS